MISGKSRTLLLRADAGPTVGSGHASRLLALGEAWGAGGGRVELLTRAPSEALRARAREAGAAVVALPLSASEEFAAVKAAVTAAGAGAWLAIDGYGFDAAYLKAAAACGARVLAVDDSTRLDEYPVDAVLDQNAGAEAREYPLPDRGLPLMGPRWALLRPAFARVGAARSARAGTPRVLVSFGGADPADATGRALRALRGLKGSWEAAVVVGADNPRFDALSRAAQGLLVRLERNADMAALMEWADLALIGGGVTMLEACAAGLPALVATIAPNQEPGARALAERGAARLLGRAGDVSEGALSEALTGLLSDPKARKTLAERGRAECDGRGAQRVAAALAALSAGRLEAPVVSLRSAAPEDVHEVWRIANDPSVRANSFRGEPIPLPTHREWYRDRLADPDSRFWLVEASGVVAAQVRYSKQADSAEVHYSVRPAFRGKGLGTFALAASRPLACRELGVRRLTGYVIEPNAPSERSFVSAGWTRKASVARDGKSCAVFEASCS